MSSDDSNAIYSIYTKRDYSTKLLEEGKVTDWVNTTFIPWAAKLVIAGTLTVNGAMNVLSDEIKKLPLNPDQEKAVKTYTLEELKAAVLDAYQSGVAAGVKVGKQDTADKQDFSSSKEKLSKLLPDKYGEYSKADKARMGKFYIEGAMKAFPQPNTTQYASLGTLFKVLVDEGIITYEEVIDRSKAINYDDEYIRVLPKAEIPVLWKGWMSTLKRETGSSDPTSLGLDCDDYSSCFVASVKQAKQFLPRIYNKKFAQAIGTISYSGTKEAHQMTIFITYENNKFVPIIFDPTLGEFLSISTVRSRYPKFETISF